MRQRNYRTIVCRMRGEPYQEIVSSQWYRQIKKSTRNAKRLPAREQRDRYFAYHVACHVGAFGHSSWWYANHTVPLFITPLHQYIPNAYPTLVVIQTTPIGIANRHDIRNAFLILAQRHGQLISLTERQCKDVLALLKQKPPGE